MKRLALAVILVATLSSAASAGTYIGLGIGTSPAMNDGDVKAHYFAPEGRSGKLLLGQRWGQISVEGSLGGFSVVQENDGVFGKAIGTAYQASVSLKGTLPLGNSFHAFGHAGLQHMWITDDADDSFSASGNGYVLGAGIEYRLNLGLGAGSIFIDYGVGNANLTGPRRPDETGVSTRMWTLGLTLSI
jgi:hypothetical protein